MRRSDQPGPSPIGHSKHYKPSCSDKVPVHKLSHLEHRDDLLAVEYRQQSFVCAMLRFSLGSWSSCLRMYSQSFLVSSVRGSGSLPTTAASAASGCTGLLRAFLELAAFFGVGIRQLERAGLGCQAKNQPVFSGSRERHGESQPIVVSELTPGPAVRRFRPHRVSPTKVRKVPQKSS